MEILKNAAVWAITLLLLYLIRKPTLHFIKNAGHNAYQRAVAWVGGIIFVITIVLLIALFSSR